MSHPYESYKKLAPKTLVPVRTRINQCDTKFVVVSSPVEYGYWSSGFRAASKNNPKNVYGWRSPSAYSGNHIECNIGVFNVRCEKRVPDQCLGRVPPYYRAESYDFANYNYVAGYSGSSSGPLPYLDSTAEEAAARQASLQKFKDAKVNLAVAFAERKKTATLVTDTVTDLRKAFTELRRWNSLKKISLSLAQLWLSYRYGWMPSLMDVHGALKAIEDADNGTYRRYIVTTRARRSKSESVTSQYETTFGGYAPVKCIETKTRDLTVTVRSDAALTNAAYKRLADVGVTDPLTVAWELIPYSFVVDWFLGVGDYLDGVNALAGFTPLASSVTKCQKGRFSQLLVPSTANPSSYYKTTACSGANFRDCFAFERNVGSIAGSTILLKNNPLNLTRMMDSIALFSNVLKGR